MEALLERSADGWGHHFDEVEVPVLALSFQYGDVVIDAADPRERFFVSRGGAVKTVERDRAGEQRAHRLLESFGAIDLGCLDHVEPSIDSRASHLVHAGGDVHDYCSFSAYALPQLRNLGWQVEVADDYPYRVVESDAPWYAAVACNTPDWFALEVGVEVDGRRQSLLPALLTLLERCPDDTTLRALLRRPLRFFALPTDDGRYLPVDAEQLREVLRVLRDLYDGSGHKRVPLLCPMTRAGSLSRLGSRIGRWHGGDKVRARAEQLAADAMPVDAPLELRATLRPYQRQGVGWLQHMRQLGAGAVLADDMGLGKTLQTITHLLIEKCAWRSEHPSLVVAPTSLTHGWAREMKKFAPALRSVLYVGAQRRRRIAAFDGADVIITSYPLLSRDVELFRSRPFHILVLDEAQTIKNRRSQAHRAVAEVDASQTVALTGTPIENHLQELHALMSLVAPGLLGPEDSFQRRFIKPIEQGDDDQLAALRDRVRPYLLRRVKNDVAPELPPKTEIVRPVELRGAQRELYETIRVAAHSQVRKLIREKGLAASSLPVLDALMKLRQVCCDPRLVRVEAAREVKQSAKLQLLLGMLRQGVAEGRRTLVFSQFTSMLAIISEALLGEGIRHVTLTGETRDRQAKVDAFQRGDADVFLISLKAGGTGLTLTNADTVIHYDPWWNPAVMAQATDRAHRIGQTRPVFVYNLIVAGSVEERMLQLQERKRKIADAIFGGGLTTSLDPKQIDDLFAPLGA